MLRITLVCIIVDKQRATDALKSGPHAKGCSGVVCEGTVPVWHRMTSNYPAWRQNPPQLADTSIQKSNNSHHPNRQLSTFVALAAFSV